MASVVIRNVDETLHLRLKASAAAHRRSVAEEARELLRAAVARQEHLNFEGLGALSRRLFGAARGFDLDIPPRETRSNGRAPDFSTEDYDLDGRG